MKKLLCILASWMFLSVTAFAQVTLNFWNWDVNLRDKLTQMSRDYEKSHPGVKINLTLMASKAYWPKMKVAASTKKLPDIFSMSSGFIEEWANDGHLLDISEEVKRDIKESEYYFNLFDAGKTLTGSYHAVPYALVTTPLFYNKDMFDAAGISYPDENWTWDDFLSAAKKLTIDKDGDGKIDQWGHYFYGRYAQIEPFLYRNNGYLIDRQTNRFAPNQNATETLKFLISLVKEHKVAPQPQLMKAFRTQDVFPREQSAMFIDGSWNIANNRKIIKDKFRWGIAEVPLGPNGVKNSAYGWNDYYAIAANTKHRKEAWEFMKYITGKGISLDMYLAGKIPSYKKLVEGGASEEPGKQPKEKGLLLKIAGKKMSTSFTKGWGEWRGYGSSETLGFNGAMDKLLNEEGASYDEVMSEITKNANRVLKRHYR